jgi:hypothetical protein
MRSGGVGEFVRDGVDGLLCEDDDAMADALIRLVADQSLRSAIARHNVAQPPDHDWPRALAQFDEVYLQARRRRGAVLEAPAQSAASPGRSNGSSDSADMTTIGVIAQGPTT